LCDLFSGWTHGNGTRLPAKDRQERGGNSIATPVPVTKRLVILKISYLLEQAGLVGTGKNSGLLKRASIFLFYHWEKRFMMTCKFKYLRLIVIDYVMFLNLRIMERICLLAYQKQSNSYVFVKMFQQRL
jgi:hypothetical protein